MFGGTAGRHLNPRERRIARERETEARVGSLTAYTKDMQLLASQSSRADTVAKARRMNDSALRAGETMFAQMEEHAAKEGRRKARQFAQDEALAKELAERNRLEEATRREVQRICETDPGLRELQNKLKMAYVSKERKTQLAEQEAIRRAEERRTAHLEAQMDREREIGIRAEREKEAARREMTMEGRKVIEYQMEEKERRRFLEGREEARREKEAVDDMVRQILARDAADAKAKADKLDENRRFIKEFQEEQRRFKMAERDREREAEAKIMQYAKRKEGREAAEAQRKAADEAAKERVYRAIVAAEEARKAREEEEERLRWLLVEEEAEQKRMAADRASREAKAKALRDMMAANEEQKRFRRKMAAEEAEREAAVVRDFEAKIAADEARERQIADERRKAKVDHMAEIERQKAIKMRMLELQKAEALAIEEAERAREAFRARVVEEARRKLLEEHAEALKDYLPKGVLQSKEDLELVYSAVDKDRDGRVTAGEMEAARARFMHYDEDADGRLDDGERRRAMAAVRSGTF